MTVHTWGVAPSIDWDAIALIAASLTAIAGIAIVFGGLLLLRLMFED